MQRSRVACVAWGKSRKLRHAHSQLTQTKLLLLLAEDKFEEANKIQLKIGKEYKLHILLKIINTIVNLNNYPSGCNFLLLFKNERRKNICQIISIFVLLFEFIFSNQFFV